MDKKLLKHEVESKLLLLSEELRSFVANVSAGTYRKAVHNLYYAAYNAAGALLWSVGIGAESHEGTQSLLSLHFVKPGKLPKDTAARLNRLMALRHAADYKGSVPVGIEEIHEERAWVVGFVRSTLVLIRSGALRADDGDVVAAVEAAAAASLPKPT